MSFDLLSFLERLLAGLDVPDLGLRAKAWLDENGAEYPDLKDRTDALAVWLGETLAAADDELDPATMANTLKGIAADIVYGNAGVSPTSHLGMA